MASSTLSISTALANYLMTGGSLKDAIDTFVVNIYEADSAMPASADAAVGESDVLLCTISVDDGGTGGTIDSTAVSGVASKTSTETWYGTNIANGTKSYFRIQDVSDPNGSSTTYKRIQGSVGTVNADFLVKTVAAVIGEEQRCDTLNIGIPMSA